MTTLENESADLDSATKQATSIFAGALGVVDVPTKIDEIGNKVFLKFIVGRKAPIYDNALRITTRQIPEENPFRGLINLMYQPSGKFPQSLESSVLQNIITRETRQVVQRAIQSPLLLSSVAFQNQEDQKLIQPATHLIVGRRGVGKSTLIRRAVELLENAKQLCIVIDMQAFSETHGEALTREVLSAFASRLAKHVEAAAPLPKKQFPTHKLKAFSEEILSDEKLLARAIPELHRLVAESTDAAGVDVFLFVDDFHLLDDASQPELLHVLHAILKGACGWLKVAGLLTRLNAYDSTTRKGLQVPGDAQLISLDFTLVDPEAAESHLKTILERFLSVVGVESFAQTIDEGALRRLVWANAGVPLG